MCVVACVPLMGDDIASQHFECLLGSRTFLPKSFSLTKSM